MSEERASPRKSRILILAALTLMPFGIGPWAIFLLHDPVKLAAIDRMRSDAIVADAALCLSVGLIPALTIARRRSESGPATWASVAFVWLWIGVGSFALAHVLETNTFSVDTFAFTRDVLDDLESPASAIDYVVIFFTFLIAVIAFCVDLVLLVPQVLFATLIRHVVIVVGTVGFGSVGAAIGMRVADVGARLAREWSAPPS